VIGTKTGSAADGARIAAELDARFLAEERPELAGLVHWRGSAERPIHRWYRYREAFSPGLIEALGLADPILDPFSGCGSILLGAAQRDMAATGVDLNPLATFVSRVKLRPLSPEQLAAVAKVADGLVERIRGAEPWPLPGLSILEAVGSFYKEGNGVKYRNRRRTSSGYEERVDGQWQLERFGPDQRAFVRSRLLGALERMAADAACWDGGHWERQRVVEGSALELDALLGEEEFRSIVFSPPYANRFDYFEAMKVELWFGGFVSSPAEMRALRKASLRSHLSADLERPWTEIAELEAIIDCMDRESSSWRMGVPDVLRGYFDDMATVLAKCRAALGAGGECHVIVGNSAYAGTIVPTDLLIAQLGVEAVGFSAARVTPVRPLTVAPQQRALIDEGRRRFMRESLITLW